MLRCVLTITEKQKQKVSILHTLMLMNIHYTVCIHILQPSVISKEPPPS